MTYLLKLANADFSNKGLPNINPFVDIDNADFAFDFRKRETKFNDLSSNNVTLTPYKNDISAGIREVDSSIITEADSGLGINIEMGFLQTNEALANIPLDGSEQFTILVVGGYSGQVFPSNKVAGSSPALCSLFEYGTGISANGFSIETQGINAGSRIKSGGQVLSSNMLNTSQKMFMVLTFDGSEWSLHNKTLGTVETKTNAELGLTSLLGVNTSNNSNLVFGHVHTSSTLVALAPSLYQIARWNKVLSSDEINEQYTRSKAVFNTVGI